MKKKEKEIEGGGYEEEEAVKERSQTQQRGRVPMKLFFFFFYTLVKKKCVHSSFAFEGRKLLDQSEHQAEIRVFSCFSHFRFSSPTPSFVSVVISIPYFISFYKVMKYTETIQ